MRTAPGRQLHGADTRSSSRARRRRARAAQHAVRQHRGGSGEWRFAVDGVFVAIGHTPECRPLWRRAQGRARLHAHDPRLGDDECDGHTWRVMCRMQSTARQSRPRARALWSRAADRLAAVVLVARAAADPTRRTWRAASSLCTAKWQRYLELQFRRPWSMFWSEISMAAPTLAVST